MKFNKKILLFTAILAFAFAVSACGGTQPPAESTSEQNQSQQQQDESKDISGETNNTETESTETESDSTQETVQDETIFDAATAVTAQETADGVKYTFNVLPQTADDIRALLEIYPQSDRHNTTAFFMASLVRYIEDAGDGLAMIDVLKGPQPLSDTEKAFIKERFSDKKYLPKSYFEGATPENNYEPDTPWTIVVSNEAVSAPEGYSYTTVSSGGADSPRRVCLRIKGDNHYIWEYNGVLLGIRLPAEEDPWV
ncbi:MAG: hypothetical protein E7484_04315 [Ruminococcaceae bacterium]|nr:hypothetical protein [Oscillospiraceae bacterium]